MRSASFLVVSFVAAAALVFIVYAASTLVPYVMASPGADPTFGALNGCLLQALPQGRVGFAVSPDARIAASWSGTELALCTEADGGPSVRAVRKRGISAAAFDFSGALWVATDDGLYRLDASEERVGDVAAVALVGHALGVVALDGAGKLYSLARTGAALGFASLPAAPSGGATLAANADGTLVSVVAGSGVFVFRAADLSLVRAESPCAVDFLWWTSQPSRALVACRGGWAIALQVESGGKEEAPARERLRSELVPERGVYVHGCDGLPCTAPPP